MPVVGTWACVLMLHMATNSVQSAEVRIKDISSVEGVRINQLTGLGLVTGLNGSGGTSPITRQLVVNLLQRLGQRTDPATRAVLQNDTTLKTLNTSVVIVTAELPSFAHAGSQIDVMVSAYDDATSLQGGTLIMTPLYGADGEVYAVAAGAVSTGGFSFGGQAATVQKNHPTVGRISNGAVVEAEVPTELAVDGRLGLLLNSPDFETARRMATAIGEYFPNASRVVDAARIEVILPVEFQDNVPGFIATIGSLTVTPDVPARVVINERTGTVVIGENVRISRVLITHANLSVMTGESPQVSQPAPFSEGETTVVPRTQIDVVEDQGAVNVLEGTTTVGELARALNALGVTPRDLSAIFQQLKISGDLHADLELR